MYCSDNRKINRESNQDYRRFSFLFIIFIWYYYEKTKPNAVTIFIVKWNKSKRNNSWSTDEISSNYALIRCDHYYYYDWIQNKWNEIVEKVINIKKAETMKHFYFLVDFLFSLQETTIDLKTLFEDKEKNKN